MRRFEHFTDKELELIRTGLMQWNEQVKATISNEKIHADARKIKIKFSEELTKLIDEIREETYRRKL